MLRAVACVAAVAGAAWTTRRAAARRPPSTTAKPAARRAATAIMAAAGDAAAPPAPADAPADVVAAVAAANQGHVWRHWGELDAAGRAELVAELKSVDFTLLAAAHATAVADGPGSASARGGACTPWTAVTPLDAAPTAQKAAWTRRGLDAAAAGQVAVLVLAGGQGTRLGSADPKGCFDIGLPSGATLFGLHAERVARLRQLAREHAEREGVKVGGTVHLYIMTSPATHAATAAHWADKDWYGLGQNTVHFLQQASIPAVDDAGRVLLASASTLVRSPNGNGGVYAALEASGALDHMETAGIQFVDIICVDNALARGGDPAFVGACIAAGADVGCRALPRASPSEKVGVFAADARGRLRVLEYSELPPDAATATGPDGATPLYAWANICMHFASVPFLRAAAADLGVARPLFHAARKPVKTLESPTTPAIKLELFIFDAFDAVPAAKVAIFGVDRAEAFAPVKGATGVDTPADARALVLAQGARWVRAAGGRVEGVAGTEVAPKVSYGGEGLEKLVQGRVVTDEGDAKLLGQ